MPVLTLFTTKKKQKTNTFTPETLKQKSDYEVAFMRIDLSALFIHI